MSNGIILQVGSAHPDAQYFLELRTPRTHIMPASERDQQTETLTYKHHILAPTAGTSSTIFPKLCMVIEYVEAIKKRSESFFDPTRSFSYRVHREIRDK